MKHRLFIYGSLFIINLLFAFVARAQVQNYRQFGDEIDFNDDLDSKWSLEFNGGESFTTTPTQKNIFSRLSQLYAREWIHYRLNDKWKFSLFYAYYYNKYVPEIDQRKAPEWRSAMQAIYYIHNKRAVITTRWRLEDRHIRSVDSIYEAVERLRLQIKVVYPINGMSIAEKVFYGIGAEEVFFKDKSHVSGNDIFDRNRVTIGAGYGLTKSTQLEITYVNEYLPRSPVSDSYNLVQVNLVFNNLFSKLKHHFLDNNKRDSATAD